MGGSYYDRDVGHTGGGPGGSAAGSGGFDYGTYSAGAASAMSRGSASTEADPNGREVSTDAEHPVVIGVDVTGSMADWPMVIWDKLPMLFGQIMIQGYLKDPAISFSAIGDCHGDRAPLQVCDFAKGDKLDDEIKKIWLERGGGSGSGVEHLPAESYDLFGYYYLNHCELKKPTIPFLFMCCDECFYPEAEAHYVREIIGDKNRKAPYDTPGIFKALAEKFQGNVFLLRKHYPSFDAKIVKHWTDVVGEDHVIPLEDPKAVVDVMLGVIALVSGARDLDSYAVDMKGRDQTKERIASVKGSLKNLGENTAIAKVDTTHLPAKTDSKKRGGKGGKRL